jgi:pimeloyl-ACP methyl ester carboxylesterase
MSGVAVVALPGMLCTEQLWSQPGFNVGPDRQLRPLPLQGSTIEEMVGGVLRLPHPQMSLVGLSLGGIVALRVAEAAPDRVTRVMVLSATARPPRPEQRSSWDSMATRATEGAFTSITPGLLPMLLNPAHRDDRGLRAAVVAMADHVGPTRLLEQLSAQHSRTDLRPALPRITCPILVCAGEDDVLAPVEAQREIVDGVPHGVLHVVANSGHLSPLEQPAEVSRLVREWAMA